jgi:hypothetical protein
MSHGFGVLYYENNPLINNYISATITLFTMKGNNLIMTLAVLISLFALVLAAPVSEDPRFTPNPFPVKDYIDSNPTLVNPDDIANVKEDELGICIDICGGRDGGFPCMKNICSRPGLCFTIPLIGEIHSIIMVGSTYCRIWESTACNGPEKRITKHNGHNLDALHWAGLRMGSWACWRPN